MILKAVNEAIFSSISNVKWAKKYYKFVLNILCDLICDVTSFCVLSCDTGKINVYDKIVIENDEKRENMEIK